MNIDVGRKIHELRKSKSMTQEELAAEMGVSIAAVSKWETGNSIPDILMLCSIADFFDISTDELLGRTKKRRKIIVADDVEFIRDSLKSILSTNDYDLIGEATEGKELLDMLKFKEPDIIFLDINMPVMDGITALKRIIKEYPKIKVIMCSAVTDKVIIDSAIAAGASGYITKPFFPDAIIKSLKEL